MEKSSLCGNLKQHSISNTSRNMKQMHEFKVKGSSWDFGNYDRNCNLGEGDLVGGGFSWPPRSYICNFCKREFRSAQALGGHMNVHRRDRARLRQLSPTNHGGGQFSLINLNLDPNPSLNSNPISSPSSFPSSPPPLSSLLTKFPQFTSKLPPLGPLPEMKRWGADADPVQDCRPIATDLMKQKAGNTLFGVEKIDSLVNGKGCENFKKSGFVRLDLEIGLISQSKEEPDLELRLGYT